jgi:hypothetical protein
MTTRPCVLDDALAVELHGPDEDVGRKLGSDGARSARLRVELAHRRHRAAVVAPWGRGGAPFALSLGTRHRRLHHERRSVDHARQPFLDLEPAVALLRLVVRGGDGERIVGVGHVAAVLHRELDDLTARYTRRVQVAGEPLGELGDADVIPLGPEIFVEERPRLRARHHRPERPFRVEPRARPLAHARASFWMRDMLSA